MAEITHLSDRAILVRDLLQESNHRIANQLSLLVAMVQSHTAALKRGPALLPRDDVCTILNQMSARIVAMAHLHRRLVNMPETHGIDLSHLLVESCAELSKALSLEQRVRFRHTLDSHCPVSADETSALSLLVCEIVMNAVKYAHPTGLPVEISVACSVTREGRSCVDISDDGVGLPEGFDEARDGGVGLRLIRGLADKINADLTIRSDDLGLSFCILLPKREAIGANVVSLHPQPQSMTQGAA